MLIGMAHRSPTLEGFRLIWLRPSLGLAEIAWRWSFWAAAWFLVLFAIREYLDSLRVGSADMVLLKTRQPMLVSKAMSHIFHGTSTRVAVSACIVFIALSVAWVVVASLGRAVSLRDIFGHFQAGKCVVISLRSLLGIHFLRAALLLAALVGIMTAALAAGTLNSRSQPAPGSAVVAFGAVTFIVWITWAFLNWILSLAPIFVAGQGSDTFAAIAAAAKMCSTRLGPVTAVSTWFGLAHIVAWFAASSIIAFPLGFASLLPFGIVLGGILLVTLLYFAVADWLYIGRLVGYVAILEMPAEETGLLQAIPSAPLVSSMPSGRIDPDELILSDVPV